jgi:WXG100 family type VII secretion target
MADINVGYEGLQQAAGQLKSGREELDQKLQQLQSIINNLTSSEFKTQVASGKFAEFYQQWTTSARGTLESLDGMSNYLNQVMQGHEQLDQQLAGGISG